MILLFITLACSTLASSCAMLLVTISRHFGSFYHVAQFPALLGSHYVSYLGPLPPERTILCPITCAQLTHYSFSCFCIFMDTLFITTSGLLSYSRFLSLLFSFLALWSSYMTSIFIKSERIYHHYQLYLFLLAPSQTYVRNDAKLLPPSMMHSILPFAYYTTGSSYLLHLPCFLLLKFVQRTRRCALHYSALIYWRNVIPFRCTQVQRVWMLATLEPFVWWHTTVLPQTTRPSPPFNLASSYCDATSCEDSSEACHINRQK